MVGVNRLFLGRSACPRGYSLERVGGHCHGDRSEHDHGLDHIVHYLPCSSQLRQNLAWALVSTAAPILYANCMGFFKKPCVQMLPEGERGRVKHKLGRDREEERQEAEKF